MLLFSCLRISNFVINLFQTTDKMHIRFFVNYQGRKNVYQIQSLRRKIKIVEKVNQRSMLWILSEHSSKGLGLHGSLRWVISEHLEKFHSKNRELILRCRFVCVPSFRTAQININWIWIFIECIS